MSPITDTTSHFQCITCKNELTSEQAKRCQRCKSAIYCGVACQKTDWKAHKIVCLDLSKPYIEENKKIRSGFLMSKEHIAKTQEAILAGAGHLNPETSTVVVCGAQFYDGGFVEPLPQLLEKCKKLVLVDVDPVSLDELHRRLGSSPKVTKAVLDLSDSLKNIPKFREETAAMTDPNAFADKIADFFQKTTKETIIREGFPAVLEERETADYVISSLVSSQLAVRLKALLFSIYQDKFGESMQQRLMDPRNEDRILPAYELMATYMPSKHAFDLSKLAGAKGRIYLSDTMGAFGGEITLVPPKAQHFIHKIMKPAGGGEPITWQWKYKVSILEEYEVKAFLR